MKYQIRGFSGKNLKWIRGKLVALRPIQIPPKFYPGYSEPNIKWLEILWTLYKGPSFPKWADFFGPIFLHHCWHSKVLFHSTPPMILASFWGKIERRSRFDLPQITLLYEVKDLNLDLEVIGWSPPLFLLSNMYIEFVSLCGIWERDFNFLCVLALYLLHRFELSMLVRLTENMWSW